MKFIISCDPSTIKAITGIIVVILVIILLTTVWFKLRLTVSLRSCLVIFLVSFSFKFSRIRSNATIVSLIEYPIIDKIAAINIDDTSKLVG